jgi:hypothetical protein
MAFNILAEALARIEHKIDKLLIALGPQRYIEPMHFAGQTCPVCKSQIDYLIDIQNNVVVRRCGCRTNMLPSIIPLQPAAVDTKGANNASGASSGSPASDSD